MRILATELFVCVCFKMAFELEINCHMAARTSVIHTHSEEGMCL